MFGGGVFSALLIVALPVIAAIAVAMTALYGYALWSAFTAQGMPMRLLGASPFLVLVWFLILREERERPQ